MLINRRGVLKGRLTRTINFTKGNTEDIDIGVIKARRDKCEELWREYDKIQSEIEDEMPNMSEEHEAYRNEFEELYFQAIAECEKLIKKSNNITMPNSEHYIDDDEKIDMTKSSSRNDSYMPKSSIVKLAAINIPVFSGDYKDWSAFNDMFMALVHMNDSLSPVQKFFYLRSSITGAAASVIKSLETTAKNYDTAWATLTTRYSNKKVLAQAHTKALFDLEPIVSESSVKLRQLTDSIIAHMNALETLDQNPKSWGALLIHLITTKLDSNTLTEWEMEAPKTNVASIELLITFLQKRCQILEAVESAMQINVRSQPNIPKKVNNSQNKLRSTSSYFSADEIKCFICKQSHTIYRCPTFLDMSVPQRIQKATDLNLCKICLRIHSDKKCKFKKCFKCNKAHNSLLHLVKVIQEPTNKDNEVKTNVVNSESITTVTAHAYHNYNDQIILPTAIVRVIDKNGLPVVCRALLDSGSQSNFITEDMAQTLSIKREKVNCSVSGIQLSSHTARTAITIKLTSRFNDYQSEINCLVLSKLTSNIPIKSINLHNLKIPEGIELADPLFTQPQKIDLILGAGVFFDCLCQEQIKYEPPKLIFQKTQLGWIVGGRVFDEQVTIDSNTKIALFTLNKLENDINISEQISKFWELEECLSDSIYTSEEIKCKNYFEKTVIRDSHGRFVVKLPFRNSVVNLGNSRNAALRRFKLLERRFSKNPLLHAQYVRFMQEYASLGHMELLDTEHEINTNEYFLPHHAVEKLDSVSTKLRVVFDGSCRTSNGLSLNEVLLKGPSVQQDLVCILARFRTHYYALSADITKMYRQIWLNTEHTNYQKIFWRENSNQPLLTYRLKTVTYGTTPASYLATGCLNKLADEEFNNYPTACEAIRTDFCVDDYLGGASTKEDALQLRNDLIQVTRRAGFELRKWVSNDKELLNDIPNKDNTQLLVLNLKNDVTKILGLKWNTQSDTYQYNIQTLEIGEIKLTKRIVLSKIASIFDPLGLIVPVVTLYKLFMQKVWQMKLNWDDQLPKNLINEWQNYMSNLHLLNNLKIPRCILGSGNICRLEVHGFSDASIVAYGACLYLRTINERHECNIRLICAKSRVAPLKTISLPRLELCGAQLLARLSNKIITKLNIQINEKYFWTDSTVTLAWIKSLSAKWKTFVAHRVGEIQSLTSVSEWYHVRTKDNPADILSRGCTPNDINNQLWWEGPIWLKLNKEMWPKDIIKHELHDQSQAVLEAKQCTQIFSVHLESTILQKYSSFSKLLRIVSLCLRFKINTLKCKNRIIGPIQPDELRAASVVLIKMVQNNNWAQEIKDLQNYNQVSGKSKLKYLKPFIDENGVIRVGGRLNNAASISVFQRHPMLLPANSNLTTLLFRYEHLRLLHAGPQAILSSLREQYWPINGRNIARKIVHQCITCFRLKPTIVQPLMSSLPKERVNPSRPFKICGIDYSGPINVKSSLQRKAPITKGYICIFVCFATKAIHIELASDLSTECFLNALRRFCSRRGICSDIYSDNATNFVGANRKLHDLKKMFLSDTLHPEVRKLTAELGIRWHFIPPRSPHFGGLWEAAIKSVKTHLNKLLGNAILTYEELNTVLVRIEACLNSRPLTPLSSDPSDLSPLTPGHFLVGSSLISLPEPDYTTTPLNRLTRWRRVSHLLQEFWRRWSKDYLVQLQQRSKWEKERGPRLRVGTVVIMRDDNLPPLHWKLGRVKEVHVGSDGVIRVATISTSSGQFKRAVRLLCPLPFEDNHN